MRISDCSLDVCSSDLLVAEFLADPVPACIAQVGRRVGDDLLREWQRALVLLDGREPAIHRDQTVLAARGIAGDRERAFPDQLIVVRAVLAVETRAHRARTIDRKTLGRGRS